MKKKIYEKKNWILTAPCSIQMQYSKSSTFRFSDTKFVIKSWLEKYAVSNIYRWILKTVCDIPGQMSGNKRESNSGDICLPPLSRKQARERRTQFLYSSLKNPLSSATKTRVFSKVYEVIVWKNTVIKKKSLTMLIKFPLIYFYFLAQKKRNKMQKVMRICYQSLEICWYLGFTKDPSTNAKSGVEKPVGISEEREGRWF